MTGPSTLGWLLLAVVSIENRDTIPRRIQLHRFQHIPRCIWKCITSAVNVPHVAIDVANREKIGHFYSRRCLHLAMGVEHKRYHLVSTRMCHAQTIPSMGIRRIGMGVESGGGGGDGGTCPRSEKLGGGRPSHIREWRGPNPQLPLQNRSCPSN